MKTTLAKIKKSKVLSNHPNHAYLFPKPENPKFITCAVMYSLSTWALLKRAGNLLCQEHHPMVSESFMLIGLQPTAVASQVTWKVRNVCMSLGFPVMLLQPSQQTDTFSFGYTTCERNPKKSEKLKQILLIDMSIF